MKILISGTSGFIGFNIALKLLKEGIIIIGIDNENDYYDIKLKQHRRHLLEQYPNFTFYNASLESREQIEYIFSLEKPDKVLNLASQPGVRDSLINPYPYIQSNIVGFQILIELSKLYEVSNFVYASSSSVYGKTDKSTFSVLDSTDKPLSLYAATKKTNELIAHAYSNSFGLNTTGLRFFTVYGPYSRPDLVTFMFTDKIAKGLPIDLFNKGNIQRDFTYIDDIVDGIYKALFKESKCEIFNLGNTNSIELNYLVDLIEKNLGKQAIRNYLPANSGDVLSTNADIEYTKEILNWAPKVKIEKGIEHLIDWYKDYYKI